MRSGSGVVVVSLRIEDGVVVETATTEPDITAYQTARVANLLRRDLGL